MCKYFPGFFIHVPNGNYREGTREYEKWKVHTCSKNHSESAGSMESKCNIYIFKVNRKV